MKIEHILNGNGGYFKATIDGAEAGLMSYDNISPYEIAISQTVVESRFAGDGIGPGMLSQIVGFARANNLKIIPLCWFARTVFASDKTLRDVLSYLI